MSRSSNFNPASIALWYENNVKIFFLSVVISAGLPYTHTTYVRRTEDFRGGKFLPKKKKKMKCFKMIFPYTNEDTTLKT